MRSHKPLCTWLFLISAILSSAGCQQKMAKQPSYKPLDVSTFFEDGQSARPLVQGVVARGRLRTDLAMFTGKTTPEAFDWIRPAALIGAVDLGGFAGMAAVAAALQNGDVDAFPFPITREILHHGRDRYMIYCVVCHDTLGAGRGKIVERGYTAPPSYHIERLRAAPVGRFFEVITRGYGSMPSYAEQVPPRDRWAIVAYVRALQLSQHFPVDQMTDPMRQAWEESRRTMAKEEPSP